MYKRAVVLIIMMFLLFTIFPTQVKAMNGSENEDFDYDGIQNVMDNILSTKDSIGFQDYVKELMSGNEVFSVKTIVNDIKNGVINEIKANMDTFVSLLTMGIIAAVFTNISLAFQNKQVANTGFYVTYLLMFSIITASFVTVSSIAHDTLEAILSFMKALVPTYFLSVAFSSSAGTSTVFYQGALLLISLVDMLLIKLVIPLINIYLIISLANNIANEDLLSKLVDLISIIIKGLLRVLLGAVILFNTIQGLILPVTDKMKKTVLVKSVSAIPAVGNVLGSIAESVMGASSLIKTAIGIAGMIILIIICAVPIIQLLTTTFIYSLCSAIIQPVSDKRILNCITASASATYMLLRTVIVGVLLFLVTIGIVAVTTG